MAHEQFIRYALKGHLFLPAPPLAYVRRLQKYANPQCQAQLQSIDRVISSVDPLFLPRAVEESLLDFAFRESPAAVREVLDKVLLPWIEQLAVTNPAQISRLANWPPELPLQDGDLDQLTRSGRVSGPQLAQICTVSNAQGIWAQALRSSSSSKEVHGPGTSRVHSDLGLAVTLLDKKDVPWFLDLWGIGSQGVFSAPWFDSLRKIFAPEQTAQIRPLEVASPRQSSNASQTLSINPRARLTGAFKTWLEYALKEPALLPIWGHLKHRIFKPAPEPRVSENAAQREEAVFLLLSAPPPPETKAMRIVLGAVAKAWPQRPCLSWRTILRLASNIERCQCPIELSILCIEACQACNELRLEALQDRLGALLEIENTRRDSVIQRWALRKALKQIRRSLRLP